MDFSTQAVEVIRDFYITDFSDTGNLLISEDAPASDADFTIDLTDAGDELEGAAAELRAAFWDRFDQEADESARQADGPIFSEACRAGSFTRVGVEDFDGFTVETFERRFVDFDGREFSYRVAFIVRGGRYLQTGQIV